MEELLQRLSTSKRVTWLMSQAVALSAACLYALMLPLTMPSPKYGLLRFPDLEPVQMMALCVVLALPVLLVRRLPATVFAVILGESILGDAFGARPLIMFVLLVGVGGYLAAQRPKAAAVGSVAGVAAAFVNDIHIRGQNIGDQAQWTGWLAMWFALAWVFGGVYRKRREYLEALHEQTAARVVMSERLRIARELHDSVAHSIGIITVLSGAAARVVDTKPEQTRQALTGIETTSRETLLELQRMLGALRRAEPDDAMPQAAPLAPAGSLADVPQLAERTAGAGVRVHVTWQGEQRPLPPEIELSAFRIIQESVTNVVRHSGARTCQVAVGYEPTGVRIEVVDDGDDGLSGPARPKFALGAGGNGFGLLGMRERVTLLSGQFSADRRPEGGFRVTARLPA
ncbi:histidine kinase [Catenulispora acidiphila DSM 44928]|uniref:histidine kinase n=1 Tax=Catenulispora acidiphila (strain DSM 44928 / JCM 14897 / NBRC 102108 / NRRL B-24433 / ID139908) TaxID=479433 RepID=C7Q3M9_CATAD|nr:sensor histidine kinase [Catenulispora acidiphila]ACU75794.1 histidine kinase [Catenulispora acidiphila DSM 44928]